MVSTCSRRCFKNEEVKILRDFMIQCDRDIKARKPDIAAVNKNERNCTIIDIAIPRNVEHLHLLYPRNQNKCYT